MHPIDSCYLRLTWLLLILVAWQAAAARAAPPVYLASGHAHNDYYHKRPLLDALELGFASIEVDVFLVGDELLVGHALHELKPGRTLRRLYLNPLLERTKANGGSVYGNGEPLTLLIDIKSEAESTYRTLRKQLLEYQPILTEYSDGEQVTRAVDVVISGNRPMTTVREESLRLAGIDGRLSEFGEASAEWMPLVSDHWPSHFTWAGSGPFPESERQALRDTVRRVHDKGARLRFWATPDDPAVWRELRRAGVDTIGVDDLDSFSEWSLRHEADARDRGVAD